MPNGLGGSYGKAVPTYVTADAETAPIPKITIEDPPAPAASKAPPAKRSLLSRLGDLPMRVIYRTIAAGVAAIVVAVAAVVLFVTGTFGKGTPTAAAPAGPVGTPADPGTATGASSAPSVLSSSPGTPIPSAAPSLSASAGVTGAVAPAQPSVSASVSAPVPVSASASVSASSSAGPSPAPSVSASASGAASVTGDGATPVPTATPGMRSPLAAAKADPRLPALPSNRKLADFPGRGAPVKGRVKDKRSGITFARFTKGWKLAKSSPFATRRTLAHAKGAGHRALLASCPVPIAVQDTLKDTAFLAARWTLNYHPAGSTVSWTASQPIKAGKRDGWLLGYRVQYKVGGKKHVSTAAVALVDVPGSKPALVFVSIPDAQKKRWADINTVVSSLRIL
ncbi:hypothetical protein AB0M95_08300 [Sphaerisporangium sp. NPDC051017]|uniref:hypothetical protein n=1 Tax=Sphaerisporangium sp. NPDC051017 TaxID=3154636 RepID=UPI003414844F